jgi:hypothetical protein
MTTKAMAKIIEELTTVAVVATRVTHQECLSRGVRLTQAQIEAVADAIATHLMKAYVAREAVAPTKKSN